MRTITRPQQHSNRPLCGPLPKITLDEFGFNKANLLSKHINQLRQIAKQIADSHQSNQRIIQIVVVGHTDKQGTDNYNLGLGLQRASAAGVYLRNVLAQHYNHQLQAPLSMRVETEGEFTPVSNVDAKNRRVEIHLLCQRLRRFHAPQSGTIPSRPPYAPPPPSTPYRRKPAPGRHGKVKVSVMDEIFDGEN